MAKSAAPVNPKEFLIKAKFYKAVSLVFVAIGLAVFMMLYIKVVDGRMMEALKNPFTLGIFIVPFIPAAVLSFIADRNEKKYNKLSADKKS